MTSNPLVSHVQVMLSALAARPDLVHAQHFEIANEIWDVCRELEEEAFDTLPEEEITSEQGTVVVRSGYPDQPSFHRLPAPAMTLLIPDASGDPALLLLEEDKSPMTIPSRWVEVTMIAPNGTGKSAPLGRIGSGKDPEIDEWILDAEGPEKNFGRFHILLDTLPYLLALINTPRMVSKSPSAPRADRKRAHRGEGFAVDAWHRVTWDLSKETVAKVSCDPSFHKVALHWRRGHFRRAEKHYKGAIQRSDLLRPEDKDSWWQWIEGQWVGHPAFGIRRSSHAPQLKSDNYLLQSRVKKNTKSVGKKGASE